MGKMGAAQTSGSFNGDVSENGGFSPQIIHFNRVFQYKPSIFWGTTSFGNTQMGLDANWGTSNLMLKCFWSFLKEFFPK